MTGTDRRRWRQWPFGRRALSCLWIQVEEWAPNLWVEQYVSCWWRQVWFSYWTQIVLLYVIRFYLHNWCGKGWPMVVCLARARVVLYQMLSLINVYEMINTRNSLIAYIMIYKFIIHLICGCNMDGGGCCTPWQSVGLFLVCALLCC